MTEVFDSARIDRLLKECEGLIAELPLPEESAVIATMFSIRCMLTNSADDSAECASDAHELAYGSAMDSIGLWVVKASDAGKLEALKDNPLVQQELSRQERDLTEIETAEKNGVPYATLVPVLMQRAQDEAKDFLPMG